MLLCYVTRYNVRKQGLKELGSRVVTRSLTAMKRVKEGTDWLLQKFWLPLLIKTSASCLCQLRSKVLQNHDPPQEVMNNILPLHELSNFVGFIYHGIFLFGGGCITVFCVGWPLFQIIWNAFELVSYVF